MVTVTCEDIRQYGFEEVGDAKNETYFLDRPNVMVTVKRKDDKYFRISRARDSMGRYLDPQDNPRVFEYENFRDLLDMLGNSRWAGIDRETKNMLIKLASSSPDEDTTLLLEDTYKRIQTYSDHIRTQLELEFDIAAQAQFHEPTRKKYMSAIR